MKYPRNQFEQLSDGQKIGVIRGELQLATHNATTKEDLLMMLEWAFERLEAVKNGN